MTSSPIICQACGEEGHATTDQDCRKQKVGVHSHRNCSGESSRHRDPMKGKQGVWSAWSATPDLSKFKNEESDTGFAKLLVILFTIAVVIVLIGLAIYSLR